MYTVLIGAICNIILDPILMFVFHMVFGALPWPPSYPRESPLPGLSCS